MAPLPPPTCTTDVYLAEVLARLDAVLAALKPAPAPQPAPARRTRTKGAS